MASGYTIFKDWGKQILRIKGMLSLNLDYLKGSGERMLVTTNTGEVEARPVPTGDNTEISFENIYEAP